MRLPLHGRSGRTTLRLAALLDLRPGVSQRDGSVEDRLSGRRVRVDAEVPHPPKLIPRAWHRVGHRIDEHVLLYSSNVGISRAEPQSKRRLHAVLAGLVALIHRVEMSGTSEVDETK